MSSNELHVLLVEDTEADALLVQAWLEDIERMSFDVTHVTNVTDAIRELSTRRFDVILLDLILPDSERLETVIRVHQAAPGVPIVIMTSLEDEALLAEAIEVGAQDYLVKGYVDDQLLEHAIRFAVERQRILNEKFIDLRRAVEMIGQRQLSLKGFKLAGWDLTGISLERADLEEANLDDSLLTGVNLRQARLRKASLCCARLQRADLQWADLSEANLRSADLTDANLRWANLSGADLTRANLTEVSLQHANLEDANLDGTNLERAAYGSETILPDGFDPAAAGMIAVGD